MLTCILLICLSHRALSPWGPNLAQAAFDALLRLSYSLRIGWYSAQVLMLGALIRLLRAIARRL